MSTAFSAMLLACSVGEMADGRVVIRTATEQDYGFLRTMLYEAAVWRSSAQRRPPLEEVLGDEHVSRYIREWGREGDVAVIASKDGERVGAAWYRFLSAEEPGYGFIDESIPELSVGVTEALRGRGIGLALIQRLLEEARRRGVAAVSLSVEEDNPAVRLYERCAFNPIERVGNTWTMKADLVAG